jgi:hypothetical protein
MDFTVYLPPTAPPESPPLVRPVIGPPVAAIATPQHEALLTLKNEIDRIAPINTWDDAKKITNPYEFVFLSLQKRMHRSIAATQPLSRSYFKMIELWDVLELPRRPLNTAHTAEGPGGFIEATLARASGSRCIAMTLRSTERTIPGWRKSQAFLAANPTVAITYGTDDTGNLYSIENQLAYAAAARAHFRRAQRDNSSGGSSLADLYTADGGFDFSTDYNGQENTVQRLLAAEALAGLHTLRPGGTMVIKVFDTTQVATLELLWALGTCFERTAIIKPHTSRPANSERYWVGQGLRHQPAAPWVTSLLLTMTATDAPHGWTSLFQERPWTADWLTAVRVFHARIESLQIASIQMTLNIIRSPTRQQIYELLTTNVHRSRAWCRAHQIPENPALLGLTDEQVASLNLEEALAPFQAAVARMSLPTLFRPLPMPHVPIARPTPPLPTAPAWRSALPPSIRDPGALRTGADTLPPIARLRAPPESHGVPAPAPVPPAHRRSSGEPQWSDDSHE